MFGNPRFTNRISNSALTLIGHFAAPYPVIDMRDVVKLEGTCGPWCINLIALTHLKLNNHGFIIIIISIRWGQVVYAVLFPLRYTFQLNHMVRSEKGLPLFSIRLMLIERKRIRVLLGFLIIYWTLLPTHQHCPVPFMPQWWPIFCYLCLLQSVDQRDPLVRCICVNGDFLGGSNTHCISSIVIQSTRNMRYRLFSCSLNRRKNVDKWYTTGCSTSSLPCLCCCWWWHGIICNEEYMLYVFYTRGGTWQRITSTRSMPSYTKYAIMSWLIANSECVLNISLAEKYVSASLWMSVGSSRIRIKKQAVPAIQILCICTIQYGWMGSRWSNDLTHPSWYKWSSSMGSIWNL